jgi:hypothetical protein
MKILAASAILLASTASAFPSFLRSHRALMNQQCLDETDGFVEDSLMAAAYVALEGEIEDMAACSGAVLDNASCQVDFATFENSEEFMQVCESLGGKTVKLDASVDCSYATTQIARADGVMVTLKGFNFKYTNLMDCVSSQCEDTSVKDKIVGVIDNAATDVAKTTGATCTYTVGSLTSTDGGEVTSVEGTVTGTVTGGGDVTSSGGEGSSSGTGGSEIFVKDSSSAQCRSLMTAAIGVPLLALAV